MATPGAGRHAAGSSSRARRWVFLGECCISLPVVRLSPPCRSRFRRQRGRNPGVPRARPVFLFFFFAWSAPLGGGSPGTAPAPSSTGEQGARGPVQQAGAGSSTLCWRCCGGGAVGRGLFVGVAAGWVRVGAGAAGAGGRARLEGVVRVLRGGGDELPEPRRPASQPSASPWSYAAAVTVRLTPSRTASALVEPSGHRPVAPAALRRRAVAVAATAPPALWATPVQPLCSSCLPVTATPLSPRGRARTRQLDCRILREWHCQDALGRLNDGLMSTGRPTFGLRPGLSPTRAQSPRAGNRERGRRERGAVLRARTRR